MLGHVAEPGAHADRIAGDVDAAHLDATLGRVGEPEQQAERRRLARAVRADEPDAPARHLDAQVVERGRARITLGQSVDAEKGSGVHDGRESVTRPPPGRTEPASSPAPSDDLLRADRGAGGS